RRRHTRSYGDWSSDVCSSDLARAHREPIGDHGLKGVEIERPLEAAETVRQRLEGVDPAARRYGASHLRRKGTDVRSYVNRGIAEIGRASCRERVESSGGAGAL